MRGEKRLWANFGSCSWPCGSPREMGNTEGSTRSPSRYDEAARRGRGKYLGVPILTIPLSEQFLTELLVSKKNCCYFMRFDGAFCTGSISTITRSFSIKFGSKPSPMGLFLMGDGGGGHTNSLCGVPGNTPGPGVRRRFKKKCFIGSGGGQIHG